MGMFQKAEKKKLKLRAALTGMTSGGKTYSALLLARTLVGPTGRIALIDSERGSAALYSALTEFDHAVLTDHSIESYKRAIAEAKAAKYDALIVDSMSHEWMGKGGALEEVDRARDKFTEGWRNVTPKHTGFIDDLLSFPGHVVATLRKKMDYIIEKNDKGKNEPRKVGLAPVQRDGVEYEFDVVLDLEDSGVMTLSKTRCSALREKANTLRRENISEVGVLLRNWLDDGAEPPSPDDVTREIGLVRAAAQTATSPAEIETLRKRYDSLRAVMSASEWSALGAFIRERKEALAKPASAA